MSNRDLLIVVALMALWGLNFSAIQLGVDQINPLLLTAARFFCAVIPAILFVPRPAVAWRYLVAYGLSFGVGIWGMMTLAMDMGLSPGMAGLLLQLNIVSGLALGWWLFGEVITAQKIAGAGLALAGLLLTLLLTDGSVSWAGLGLAMIAAQCWSLMGVTVKKANTDKVFAFGVWGMAFAPLPLVLLAWGWFGAEVFYQLPDRFNGRALFSILFQAWPTTLLGYWLWNRLNRRYPMSLVAPFTLLVPLFGFLGSVVFYGEQLGPVKIAACVLILTGLAIGQGWVKLPVGRRQPV
ncbi:EamA family transporter [Simiduia agarivorans]|uniref:EamA domain-containing protein n=1 Tax=Simiduia agarivorans (strain DSM 21679 / JCM 13881 / BCRC 17597 / SA1) TaxID=1117647 RepID=K4KTH6_SIMAS|nr:EamA family transporter [Simiduia agarivorans]AFU97262.1 hypothetical protein M5M_00115 [Simiduia agarivorans SA1 = DSM 21679]